MAYLQYHPKGKLTDLQTLAVSQKQSESKLALLQGQHAKAVRKYNKVTYLFSQSPSASLHGSGYTTVPLNSVSSLMMPPLFKCRHLLLQV